MAASCVTTYVTPASSTWARLSACSTAISSAASIRSGSTIPTAWQAVGIVLPLRIEAALDIAVLHALKRAHVEDAGVTYVVTQDAAMAVFLGRPQIVPVY